MTIQAIIASVQNRIPYVGQQEILDALILTDREIHILAPGLASETQDIIVAPAGVDLPEDIVQVWGVSTSSAALRPAKYETLDRDQPRWRTEAGAPKNYVLLPRTDGGRTLYLYPRSNVNVTVSVTGSVAPVRDWSLANADTRSISLAAPSPQPWIERTVARIAADNNAPDKRVGADAAFQSELSLLKGHLQTLTEGTSGDPVKNARDS